MKRILFICSLLTIVATGCKSSRPAAIGFSPDEHGCNAAAGYQWSEAKQDCVRVWEAGTHLFAPDGSNSMTPPTLILSNDRKKAEIIYPNGFRLLLTAESDNLWTTGDYRLTLADSVWTLFQNGKTLLCSSKPTESTGI